MPIRHLASAISEEFVDAVPRTVTVTLVFEEREHDCAVPVYVVEQ